MGLCKKVSLPYLKPPDYYQSNQSLFIVLLSKQQEKCFSKKNKKQLMIKSEFIKLSLFFELVSQFRARTDLMKINNIVLQFR